MTLGERFNASVARNPAAWILLGLLAIAEYGNYTQGRDLSRVCGLIADPDAHLLTQTLIPWRVVDQICGAHEAE